MEDRPLPDLCEATRWARSAAGPGSELQEKRPQQAPMFQARLGGGLGGRVFQLAGAHALGRVAEGEQHGGQAVCQAPQRGPVLRRAGGVALPYVGRELLQAAGAVGIEQKLFARKAAGNGLRLIVGRFIGQRGACGRRVGRGARPPAPAHRSRRPPALPPTRVWTPCATPSWPAVVRARGVSGLR